MFSLSRGEKFKNGSHLFASMSEDILKNYIRDISRFALLTPEQEVDLAKRTRLGDSKARDELIASNLKLAFSRAKMFSENGDLLDLVQEAAFGLITAVKRYDPELVNPQTNAPYRFSTYAVEWIDRSIKDRFRYNKCMKRTATLVQLSEVTDAVEEAHHTDDSLDKAIESSVKKECASFINQAMEKLSVREKMVLVQRYGLNGHPTATLQQLGDTYGITKEGIRQIEKKALGKLAEQLKFVA